MSKGGGEGGQCSGARFSGQGQGPIHPLDLAGRCFRFEGAHKLRPVGPLQLKYSNSSAGLCWHQPARAGRRTRAVQVPPISINDTKSFQSAGADSCVALFPCSSEWRSRHSERGSLNPALCGDGGPISHLQHQSGNAELEPHGRGIRLPCTYPRLPCIQPRLPCI